MNVASVVDPELAAMAQVPGFELSLENLPAARDYLLEMLAVPAQALSSAAVAVEERHIPGEGSAPAVRVIIYRPVSAALATPAILEIHGGGFVMGVPEQSDGHNLQLAETLGCVVVAVNYRLAPEASGMAAVDDCYTVLRWLYRDSATIGVDPQRIAVLGDSAGGGIAAGLVLLARDRGEVPIVCQVLTYPMLDDRTESTVDPGDYSGEFSWSRAANRFAWQARLGHAPGSCPLSPYLSPAHATELVGLPPTFIAVGALDLFAPESMAYAQLLIRSGVPTELHVYPGAMHGFDWVKDAAVSRQFARDRMAAVRRLLA